MSRRNELGDILGPGLVSDREIIESYRHDRAFDPLGLLNSGKVL